MTTTSNSKFLSKPLTLASGSIIPNRIAKSAMSEALAENDGSPGERIFRLYERWAKGGAGLLITGNVIFSPEGRTELANVLLSSEAQLPAFKEWARRTTQHGSQLWMQINHTGRQASKQVAPQPLAPSPIPVKGIGPFFGMPREMTAQQIKETIDGYIRTADLAKRAGFSGVQIRELTVLTTLELYLSIDSVSTLKCV